MTTGAQAVATDAEGFLLDASQWDDELALKIAHENGIAELTPQ